MRARGLYKVPDFPYILGGEGAGLLEDGRRVYFGHSIPSLGAPCDIAIVPEAEVCPIPDAIDDAQAIALAIAGTGALILLEEARIRQGERVLVLGATGLLGQIALQFARIMGATTVAAAARTLAPLERLKERGIADAVAQLGIGDDDSVLRSTAGPGCEVVLDCVYRAPAKAANAPDGRWRADDKHGHRCRAKIAMSVQELLRRSHHGVGTGHRVVQERRAAYRRLLDHALTTASKSRRSRWTLRWTPGRRRHRVRAPRSSCAWPERRRRPSLRVLQATSSTRWSRCRARGVEAS